MTLRASGGAADSYIVGSGTWAQVSAITTAAAGAQALVTDLGSAPGTWVTWSGSRWKVSGGMACIKGQGATISGITNTTQIVSQVLIPANFLQSNDTIRIVQAGGKSGTTDIGRTFCYIGTLGTTGDTVITGYSVAQVMTAPNQAFGTWIDVKVVSDTSVQKTGSTANGSQGLVGQSATLSAATTVSSFSGNALWISVALGCSGTTDTLTSFTAQIFLVQP